MAGELWQLDGMALAALIRAGKVSAREAVTSHLDRLHAVNPRLNAIVRVLDEQALAEADAADRALRAGEAVGSLHGLPVTTKVNSDQAGLPTDNGVEAYRDLIATEDSPQVGSLRRAGAIVIGRTNTPAFSMRGQTENILHGRTLNPWDPAYTRGGSSGGAGGRDRRHWAGQRHRRLDLLAGLLQRRRRVAPQPRAGRLLQRDECGGPADVRPADGRQRTARPERARCSSCPLRDGRPRRRGDRRGARRDLHPDRPPRLSPLSLRQRTCSLSLWERVGVRARTDRSGRTRSAACARSDCAAGRPIEPFGPPSPCGRWRPASVPGARRGSRAAA